MAVVENRATEDGDVLYIKTDVPIIGIITLSDFVDTTIGESQTTYFYKEFRYSLDGVSYSNWAELTNPNLSAVTVEARDTLILEYRYRRVGNDNVDLMFSDVTINGDYDPIINNSTFNNSIFARFMTQDDPEVLGWAINVLEKLYRQGIVPEFIDRGKSSNPDDDKDYVDFWRTVTTFFAYIVVYARRFMDLNNEVTLREFLKQRGCFGSGNEDLPTLKYIRDNFYREITLRGTMGMVRKVKTDSRPVYGELLRVIDFVPTDEFIFALLEPRFTGWNVNLTSPCWGGLNPQPMLNKSWEDTVDVVDLTKYPTTGNVSIDSGRMNIDAVNSGISYDADVNKLIPVSPNINYAISFKLVASDVTTVNFGIDCFNSDLNASKLYDVYAGSETSSFVASFTVPSSMYGKELNVCGIVYNKDKVNFADRDIDTLLKIGTGRHLRFSDDSAYICPRILFTSPATSPTTKIYDIKVVPYNTVFYEGSVLEGGMQLKMYAANNNKQLTDTDLKYLLRRYFINYNCGLKFNNVLLKQYEPSIKFKPFDFLVVRYIWTSAGGTDLDTRTSYTGTGITLVDDDLVGWGCGNAIVVDTAHNYLQWGGDNTGAGVEAVLINFNTIAADYSSIKKFTAKLAAQWYSSRNNGEVSVEMVTYSGGAMQKVGYDFINNGGEQVDYYSVPKIVNLVSRSAVSPGQELARVEYNAITRVASFKES